MKQSTRPPDAKQKEGKLEEGYHLKMTKMSDEKIQVGCVVKHDEQ